MEHHRGTETSSPRKRAHDESEDIVVTPPTSLTPNDAPAAAAAATAEDEEPDTKEAPAKKARTEDAPAADNMNAAAQAVLRRVKLSGVNQHATNKVFRKWLGKQPTLASEAWVQTVQIKKAPKSKEAWLTFPSVEERSLAVAALKAADLKERNALVQITEVDEQPKVYQQRTIDPNDQRTPTERIADQTTPLWKVEYAEQLEQKHAVMQCAIENAKKEAKYQHELNLLAPVPSPVQDGYRNKCEFSIGKNLEGEPTVGFNAGSYVSGKWTVGSPKGLKHISDTMLTIVDIVERFVRQSALPVWDKGTVSGFFRLILVRTTSTGQTMVILQVSKSTTEEALVAAEVANFKEFYLAEAAKASLPVTVLGLQYYEGSSDLFPAEEPVELLEGTSVTIEEELLGFKFTISPSSFFQINKPATEVMYSMVRDWAMESIPEGRRKTLLDLCCGTGTIGICMSGGNFDRILGVDIVEDAIENARANAARNGVTNAEYRAGPAEKLMDQMLHKSHEYGEIIAVLDPPRTGVHKSVIKAIKACRAISRVVFVSCDINQGKQNIVDLIRPSSNSFPGEPFVLDRACTVDMFPHTKHMEVVCVLSRPMLTDAERAEIEEQRVRQMAKAAAAKAAKQEAKAAAAAAAASAAAETAAAEEVESKSEETSTA
ncbi:hypothetical protein H9P43_009986 [Blastocladiella emersonii ATCC 22665]|nr:hypothetical protein H9P43_009986 [Blastocladiella emersonii ATCC 22665]